MPSGIMGRKRLALKFTGFSIKKIEGINTLVCALSLYVAETPKASIKKP